ncbi:bifunctional allantoicase/(S)-ureidoglycine aminohydrolase [Pseudoruegeria sp. SK021]|uniref:bifunctional allantoicase/(S)-ureidoglycine aminohydrolase n=1 Tax=Pseudoruegeria sp. SK021 TaxID=1933035 RepID=UPI000A24F0E1|nr:bifunctional allantoicase/(S)-ureidoglycine aminohydrolase [Pseudoruegeria sp. SK021]OSP56502.1 (S)-ureidoglycine aminohydrolase [Pseudoruegeria sp. SK021]
MTPTYYAPKGGLPDQDRRVRDRAVFTDAYMVMPRDVMSDIVTSFLPGWHDARAWILARPLSGFAETFAQYIVELKPGGGSNSPEPDAGAQAVLFVLEGALTVTLDGTAHDLAPGGYAYLPPGANWQVTNPGDDRAVFHWFRKIWEPAPGLTAPDPIFSCDADCAPLSMPGTNGVWQTSRFVDPTDLRHDMHITIVTIAPGGEIPFAETHVMEHGLYVLQGRGNYLLNQDWVEVEAGDYMWLRAFCPQGCYAAGREPFRYLLYKDVNRHPKLRLGA